MGKVTAHVAEWLLLLRAEVLLSSFFRRIAYS